MQSFKRLSAASKIARQTGGLIVKVGELYIVGELDTLTEVAVLTPSELPGSTGWNYAGNVSLGHLNRLGNANGAAGEVIRGEKPNAFPTRTMRGPDSTAIAKMLERRVECERLAAGGAK